MCLRETSTEQLRGQFLTLVTCWPYHALHGALTARARRSWGLLELDRQRCNKRHVRGWLGVSLRLTCDGLIDSLLFSLSNNRAGLLFRYGTRLSELSENWTAGQEGADRQEGTDRYENSWCARCAYCRAGCKLPR
jgi:hypothetical protein